MGFGLRTPHLAPDVLRWKARWVSFRACPPKIDTSMAQGSVHSTLLSVRSSTFQLDMSVQQQWVHVVRVLEVCSGFFFFFLFSLFQSFPGRLHVRAAIFFQHIMPVRKSQCSTYITHFATSVCHSSFH